MKLSTLVLICAILALTLGIIAMHSRWAIIPLAMSVGLSYAAFRLQCHERRNR